MRHCTSGIKTHSSFKSCSSLPMRLNTRFQMRLEVSRTDDHAVVQNDNSTRSALDSSLVHSSTLIPPHFSDPLTIVKNNHFSATYIFVTTAYICTTMMSFDQDNSLPPFIKLSTSPYCTNINSRYNGTHYNDNAQHFLCPAKVSAHICVPPKKCLELTDCWSH